MKKDPHKISAGLCVSGAKMHKNMKYLYKNEGVLHKAAVVLCNTVLRMFKAGAVLHKKRDLLYKQLTILYKRSTYLHKTGPGLFAKVGLSRAARRHEVALSFKLFCRQQHLLCIKKYRPRWHD